MLKIRLARGGKHKTPFFRIVLTEHTKPIKSGYKKVLGWYDPLQHTTEVDVEAVKTWIAKGAKPSNRVAKLILKYTGDDYFKKYIIESNRTRKVKNAPDEPVVEEKTEETPAEEVKEEPKGEEAPVEEKNQEEKEEDVGEDKGEEVIGNTPTEDTPTEIEETSTEETPTEEKIEGKESTEK